MTTSTKDLSNTFLPFDDNDWNIFSGAQGTAPKVCYRDLKIDGDIVFEVAIVLDETGITISTTDGMVHFFEVTGGQGRAEAIATMLNWDAEMDMDILDTIGFKTIC